MSNIELNEWVKNFERENKIHQGIIISGNTIDLSITIDEEIKTSISVVKDTLKAQGFKYVPIFVHNDHVTNIDTDGWKSLQSSAVNFESTLDDGESVDLGMGEDDEDHNLDGNIPCKLNDFISVAQKHLVLENPSDKVAFIVDWSNFVFSTSRDLTEPERVIISKIGQSLRDAPYEIEYDTNNNINSKNIIVFICNGNNTLPPALYVKNPQFKEIKIPLPNRNIREYIINANQDDIKVEDNYLELVDQTEGLTLRDIYNIIDLSRKHNDDKEFTVDSLVSLYKFGKKISPWEQLDYKKIANTKTELGKRVKGQDKAIEAIYNVLIRAYSGLSGIQNAKNSQVPKGVLFFVGPTGVGKTELAKSLTKFLFGDEDSYLRFDMSEFSEEHSDQRLVGAPPGYVGYEEGGQLTNAVKDKPFSLILFDEIEKANGKILDKFLQILGDGRLTDGKGETVLFSDTFIVFTSNIGVSEIQEDGSETEIFKKFKDAVISYFRDDLKRPEIFGRIGEANIVPFNFINNNDVVISILKSKLEPIREKLKDKWGITDVVFKDEDKALRSVAQNRDRQNGIRGALDSFTTNISDVLAHFIFEKKSNSIELKNKTISIQLVANSFLCEFK